MNSSNEALPNLVGEATGLVYRIAGDTLFGLPVGEVLGPIADDVGRGVAEDTLGAIEDISHGDLSALSELGKVVFNPIAKVNEQLIEEVPIVGPVLGEVGNALGAIPVVGGLFGSLL